MRSERHVQIYAFDNHFKQKINGSILFNNQKIIVFTGEAHTIIENLIKPCMFKVAKILLSENEFPKLKSIPLSDNAVSFSIDDVDMYIKSKVYSR